jgi:hypothetical protein
MPKLLSGQTLRTGGSGQFIDLAGAQPQLPPTPTTSTGYTLVTNDLLITEYRSSLGNLEFNLGEIWSNIPNGNITLTGTGTGYVLISSSTQSTSTFSGALVVNGGIGVGGAMWVEDDIHVNGLTIGQGFEGTNNVVIQGTAVDNVNEFNEGRASVAIGHDALLGLSSSFKNIAIGRYALSSGTNLSKSIAIGDSALKNIGVIPHLEITTITNITTSSPVIVEVLNHGLSTGTRIYIDSLVGAAELNQKYFWINVESTDTVSLYSNVNLSVPVDGSLVTAYVSSGTLYRDLLKNNNIAIGTNAGVNLMDGEQNFFFGDGVGNSLTTGSYNFFIGHEVGTNMTTGNANIAIGGDNLVDGVDNQVNIGSVFYYNGTGYLQLNSDTGLGLGTTSTGTDSGALTVLGGVGISDNLITGGDVLINSTAESTATDNGALVVAGGVGIGGNLNVNRELNVLGQHSINLSPTSSATVTIAPESGDVEIYSNLGNIRIIAQATGTVIIDGGDSIGSINNMRIGDVAGGREAGNFTDVQADTVLVTSTTDAESTDTGALRVLGGVGIAGDLYVGRQSHFEVDSPLNYPSFTPSVFVQNRGSTTAALTFQNTLTGSISLVNANGVFVVRVQNSEVLQANTGTVEIPLTTESTSTTTGALVVQGGISTLASVYSREGVAEENFLLYTPRVTISETAPLNPRVGDFWVDPIFGVELQFIQDGENRFWIQFTTGF